MADTIKSFTIGTETYNVEDIAATAAIGTATVPAVLYAEGDTIPEGKQAGDVKTAAVPATGLTATKEAVDFIKERLYYKSDKGNIELSAEGVKKTDGSTPASLNLKGDGKLALKVSEVSLETDNTITIYAEINKNGKVKVPGVKETKKAINTATAVDFIGNALKASPTLNIEYRISNTEYGTGDAIKTDDDNTATEEEKAALIQRVNTLYPDGEIIAKVNLFDLIGLVGRVAALEAKVNAPAANTPAAE